MWEWSHSPEAYENGRTNLAKKRLGFLCEALAEWEATTFNNLDTMEGPQLDTGVYHEELYKLKAADAELREAGCTILARKAALADKIWSQAEKLRTCTNGGHEAWVCPYGCHRIKW